MNITLQQWLSRQPYTQTTDSDRYYTQLANRVYDLVNISPLKERLTEEATKSLCCDVVGYFADILSGTGLWATFLSHHHSLYGRTLPFFPAENYYDGEVNREDLRVLLWYLLCTHDSLHEVLSPARQPSRRNGRYDLRSVRVGIRNSSRLTLVTRILSSRAERYRRPRSPLPVRRMALLGFVSVGSFQSFARPGSFHTKHRVNRMETKKESPSSANCVGNRYILCRPDLWRSLLTNGSLCFGNTPSPKKRKRKRNCTPITGNSPEKPEACLSNT